jgi:hypothetical protein
VKGNTEADMKKLWLRFLWFVELWGSPDPYKDGATIDAAFAWALAGLLTEFDDEMSQWEEL